MAHQPPHHPKIIPTDNDVLCGRGVNIAHHPGNERFRTLVNTKRDASQREPNSATEKRQMAEEIIRHIKGLNPPGRFLKRECPPGRRSSSRGKNGTGLDLSGTWEVVSDREAIKKTCQALRDSCRTDRSGYAVGVVAPPDVAEAAAQAGLKRDAPDTCVNGGRLSPSVENAASWLKKQKFPEPTPSGLPSADPASMPPGSMPPSNGSQDPVISTGNLVMQMPDNGTQAITHNHIQSSLSSQNGGMQQAFGSNWSTTLQAPAPYSNDLGQPQHLLQFQNPSSLQPGITNTDWGATGQLQSLSQQQDSLGVELGSPGDPGALNITEL